MKQTSSKLFTKIVSMILCICMLTTSLASCGIGNAVTPDDSDSDAPGGDVPGTDIPGGDTPGGDTPGGDTPGGDTPGGDTETTYYKVSFAVALEEFKSRVTLPNDKLYEAGTEIQFLPTPVVRDMLFMGWYYDATMTKKVALTDKVNSDLMLYAKVVDTSGDISTVEGVYYHTVYDAQTDYKFSVKADSMETAETNLSIENISSAGQLLAYGDEYTITDNGDGTYSVNVKYKAGKTYRANLVPSSGVCFVVEETELSDQVTTLNVLTAKAEVSNLTLSDSLIYIPLEDVEMLTNAPNGLVSVSTDGAVINNGVGFFRYDGAKLKSGDLVAIYEGDIPSERDFGTNNGAVKYLTVTGSEGNNVYKFKVSDSKEVLFIPDILPVSGSTNEENSARIPASFFDVNSDLYKQLGMDEDTKVEVGDYIAFFNGPMVEGTPVEYVRIDSLSRDKDSYYIDYTPVSYDDVMATMDLYHTRTETPELPAEKIEEIKAQVYNDAMNSGFLEESADYLVNLYVSTNGLESLPDGTEIRYKPAKQMANSRAGGVYYEVTKCEAKPDVKVGQGVLKHFEESDGIRVELILSFEVEFTIGEDGKNKVVIAAEAVFEEEILLSLNVDGGAVWKKAWIFPYIADYEMNANIDIGTYTGVSVIAKVYTNNGEEKEEEDDDDSFFPDFDLDNLGSGDSYDEQAKSIGEELKKLFELNDNIKEEIEGEGEEDDTGNDITEKYAEMMKDASEAWIEIVRVEIFKQSQNLDQFGILWFEISIDFVVSAQLYIMAGIEVETGVAKRYNFSVALFSRNVKTDVIDLEKAHFSFKFYVMGTAGLKVGFEVELSLALLSSDVASVGISAELGVQLGIWGYFYYSYEKEAGQPAETQKAGAMFFELGIYIEVKFKAHLFNIDKLTYNPTLYENFWPIYSVGTQENVFAFEDYTDDELSFKMQSVNKLVLPNYIFRMKYLDLKDGKYYAGKSESDETPSKVFDDATESHFVIEISDKRFSYDPKTNTLTTTVDVGNMEIDDTFSITITLTYRHGALAFNQENITRDITVTVMNDKEYRYISGEVYRYYDDGVWYSDGPAEIGSFSLPFKIGSKVTLADIPTPKASDVYPGYRFERWVYANDRGRFFRGIEEMPDEDIQLLAFWTPVEFKYPVEIYLESADGVFIYESTEYISTLPRKTLNLSYRRPGYYATAEDLTVKEAMPNETHKVYFKRADRTVRFTNLDNEGTEIFIEYKAGSPISPPVVSREGYNFGGWEVTVPYYDRWKSSIPMPETVPYEYVQKLDGYHYSYSAIWTPRDDIPYTVKHYVRDPDGIGYSLYMTEYFTGTYGEELKDRDFYSRDVVIDGYSTVYNGNKTVVELDGSSVIRLYYERLEFGVYANVDIEGESGCWVGSKIPHGATVNLNNFWPPQVTGYRFVGWDLDGDGIKDEGTFIMPKEDVDVYTLWELSDDISYEVNHFVEETWGYDFVEREYRYGTHLSTPNVEDLFLEELLSDSEILPNYEKTMSVQILAGKRNEIDVYYDRVKYNANIEVIDPNTKEVIKTVVVPLPYNALLADYLFPDLSEFDIVEGYTVSSYDYNGYYYMPKKEITIKVNYKPQDNIPFIVNHYIEKLDGSYELFTSTSHTERAGTRVSYLSWKYDYPEGFPTNTHTLNSDKIETTYVSGRGDTALNLYYDRAKVYYEGTIWKLDASGNKSIWAYHTIESRVGDYVVLNGYYPNYEFASFTNKTDDWTITAPECGFTAYANESGTNKFKFEMHVKPKEGVPYTVNYYYETIDGSGYELDPERTVYGTGAFDQYIVSRNYEKYTPGFQVNSKLTSDIKLGEDENVLEIYYSRNTYKVNFMNSDKIDCSVTVELKYGQTINDPGLDTSIPGYVFLGWGDWKEGDTVPAYDLYYLASYTPAKDTPYVVNHYTMGLDGKYTLALTENLSGLTKSTITTEAHLSSEFNGKGFSPRDSYECIILPDGSTVMDIYYVRDSFSYTYHFYFNGKIFETHGRLYAFGAALTENLNAYVEEHREYGIKGYSILEDGEYVSITAEELPTTMPSADTEIRVELEGIGPDVTIVHKIMNLDGETYSEVTTSFKVPPFEELDLQDYILESAKSGFAHIFPVNNQVPSALTENVYEIYYDRLTYTVVYINAHEYETVSESYLYGATLGAAPVFERAGYTHSGWTAELPETMPAGNVSFVAAWTVLDPVSVTVVHMMESLDGDGYVEKYRETVLATPELALSGKSYARDIVGGTFKNADRKVVANDGSTEICVYYSRNEYIIRFIFGDVPGAGEDVVLKLPYESAITPPDFKVAGYEIAGWSPEIPVTMPAENVTCIARWQVASADVTVNHYVESLDGTDRVITETETVSAETGASLNGAAYQKTYEGFTYADADKNVTVMADGSTVINVYYTRNSYNVTFTYGDKIGESVEHTVKYGAAIPTAPTFTVLGYIFEGWDNELASTMPASNLTYAAQWTADTNVQFTVLHHYQNANDDGYSEVATEVKYGTTGEMVDGANYKKTLANAIYEKAESKTVSADGSTVIKVYYVRTTHKITFTYGDKTGEGVEYTLRYGQNVAYNPSFSVTGYVFAGWDKQIPAVMPDSDVVINAIWNAADGIQYKVEHHLQNANDDDYTLDHTDNRTGVTGTVIDGTTLATMVGNGIVLKSAESKTIAADGSTVIKIYYNRASYTVTYTYGDKTGEAVEHTVRYGATLPEAPVFNVLGYTFAGWDSKLASMMPATNLTYDATWTANTDTAFTVLHYYQNANDDGYEKVETETKYGTTGATVNGADYKKELAEAIFERAESKTVNADGSTVIEVYYVRTSYTLTFTYGDKAGENAEYTLRYGQNVSYNPSFSVTGYVFAGWDKEIPATMPGENVTINATWSAGNVQFTVEHYYQNANDDGYEKVETETKYGTTGATVNGRDYAKALSEAIFERAESKTVNADGSTVIKVYYVRTSYTLTFTYGDKAGENAEYTLRYGQNVSYNPSFSVTGYVFAGWDKEIPATMPGENVTINATWTAGDGVKYLVEHYVQNADDNEYTLDHTDNRTGVTGTVIDGTTLATMVGNGIVLGSAETKEIAADGSTVIKIYYDRASYTVTYTYGDKTGEAVEHKVRYGATLPEAPVFTALGYTFAGWDNELASTMPASNLTYNATWTANTDTAFTVEHYYQNANDDGYEKVETETKHGTTGATVNGANYKKELAEAIFERTENAVIAANGSTVIKIYYDRTSYTVTYTYGDKTGEAVEHTVRYGATLPEAPVFNVLGYTFAGWDSELASTMPATNLTYDATWTANTDTEFTVEHYYQNANDDGYEKVETETKHGTTDATVNGADHVKALAEAIFERAESKTVSADGSTVIKVYYTRTTYTLTFTYGDKVGENATYTLRYGQSISYNPSFSVTGYVFAGWDKEIPATMPGENVTIDATWTASNVGYVVEHYVQNADNDDYTLDYSENRVGVTGTVIDGAAFATLVGNGIVLGSAETKEIAADGSTVIKIYYNRASYTLTFTFGQLSGTPVVMTLRYGASVPETPKFTAVGYTFVGWDSDVVGFMPASDMTYAAIWTANTDTEFTVLHYYQNANDDGYTVVNSEVMHGTTGAIVNGADLKQGLEEAIFEKADQTVIAPDGSTIVRIYYVRTSYTLTFSYGYVLDDAISYTVRYGAALPEAPVFSAQGYTFNGWLDEEELFVDEMAQEMPAHDLVYTALFMANEDTPFAVEHYVEQADGYGYDLIDTAYGEGRTGSMIDDYWQFVLYDDGVMYVFERFNSEELVINPDGSTVLKIYYQRIRYVVNFIVVDEAGNEVNGVDYITAEVKYGQTITPPDVEVLEGYVFVGFNSEHDVMPDYDIEYYIVWRCIHECNDGTHQCEKCGEPLNCADNNDDGHCDYGREPMDPDNHRYLDNNEDHICDICFGSFLDLCFDNDKNGMCDVCDQFTICPVTGEDHVDEDEMSDHLCDDCGVWMSYLCVINDGKHECKVCDARFYDMCTDEDGDCWCDECIDPIPCTDEDGDGFCDVCEKLIPCDKHVDKDQNALCDRCVENLQWCDEYDDMHRDDNMDHLCDHCGLWLSYNCSDWTDDGRCEDCYRPAYCMQELGKNHADGDGDHYCDECNCWMSYVCTDADGDWYCDECGNELQCFDHVDENKDAACDICGEETKCKANPYATYHEDSECDHVCDWCGVWVSICCIDDDYDGYCDESGCGREFVCNHVDEDEDNYCDRCYRIINCTHESVSMHICDTCNQKVTDCYSEDGDLFCDECFEEIECHHEGTMDAHVCTRCYAYLSNCYDEDGDGECDLSEYFPHSVQ